MISRNFFSILCINLLLFVVSFKGMQLIFRIGDIFPLLFEFKRHEQIFKNFA